MRVGSGSTNGPRTPVGRLLVLLLLPMVTMGVVAGLLLWRLQRRESVALLEVDQRFAPLRKAFREHQDQEMKGELSPLARVDYVHLPVGEHRVGPGQLVTLPQEVMAAHGGELTLVVGAPGAQRLSLRARQPVEVLRAGQARRVEQAALVHGDVIRLGRARLLVSGTAEDLAVAVYDDDAPARRAYRGLRYFPDDSSYTVAATLQRLPSPHTVRVSASRGGPQEMRVIGRLRFTLHGTQCTMDAYVPGPDPTKLFLIFKDQTNGQPEGSYGAGRFLYATVLPGDQVILDFNQAWNPLCAYSSFFHCPLPPRSNWLTVRLPVGERAYGDH